MSRKQHWESLYASKADGEVSWTQADPRTSLSLIGDVCWSGRIIDVGALGDISASPDNGWTLNIGRRLA
jgi:hypothetical protein